MPSLEIFYAKIGQLSGMVRRQIQIARLAIAVETSKPINRGIGYALFGVGIAAGVIISSLFRLLALLMMIAVGFAVGYGVRSYVSKRRRDRYWQENFMK